MEQFYRGKFPHSIFSVSTTCSPVTIYCESPEKAQSHIQPRDVSPGLLLLMLSSVISEKFEVLQILHVWSAEQVASNLHKIKID